MAHSDTVFLVSQRTYGQHCGLARALDLLGERWTLLVIRELARGPKRFRDLLANLPGIGTNLLAARLKALEADGVVRRTLLPPPAGVRVYELTARGRELEAPLEALALWGFELLPERPASTARAAWAATSMRAAAAGGELDRADGIYAFEIGEERFYVTVAAGDIQLLDGVPPMDPDVRVQTDLESFAALPDRLDADAGGRVRVTGDGERLRRLLRGFRLPARTPTREEALGDGVVEAVAAAAHRARDAAGLAEGE